MGLSPTCPREHALWFSQHVPYILSILEFFPQGSKGMSATGPSQFALVGAQYYPSNTMGRVVVQIEDFVLKQIPKKTCCQSLKHWTISLVRLFKGMTI